MPCTGAEYGQWLNGPATVGPTEDSHQQPLVHPLAFFGQFQVNGSCATGSSDASCLPTSAPGPNDLVALDVVALAHRIPTAENHRRHPRLGTSIARSTSAIACPSTSVNS